MEWARYRDMTRIFFLIIGAFSITYFVRRMLLMVLGGPTLEDVVCGPVLVAFLVVGIYLLYFGLDRWDRFYTDVTAPQPVYPAYAYYQPVYYPPPVLYYPQPAYYPRPYGQPAYGVPAYHQQYPQERPPAYHPPPAFQHQPAAPPQPPLYQPRPAYVQPAGQYPQPVYYPPAPPRPVQPPQANSQPVYPQSVHPPQAYSQPVYPQPVHPQQAYSQPVYPQPVHPQQAYSQPFYPQPVPPQPFYQQYPRYPPRPLELDPRRALILPDATWLLAVFLLAVLVGGMALAAAYYVTVLALVVFLPAFIIGFSFPSLIWISYVYHHEKTHLLPSRTVLKAFVWGMLSTVPALLVNTAAGQVFGYGAGASLASTLVVIAVVAPLIEEFSKPWGAWLVREDVRGPLDGLILGVTCGVGFALIENITYEAEFALGLESGPAVWVLGSLVRGLGSIMVHAAGAGMIGYAYGRHRTGGGLAAVVLAFLAAVAMHSAWNGASAVFSSIAWGLLATAVFMGLFVAGTYYLLTHLIARGAAAEAQAAGETRV